MLDRLYLIQVGRAGSGEDRCTAALRRKEKVGVRLFLKLRLGRLVRVDLPFDGVIGEIQLGKRLPKQLAVVHADPIFGHLTGPQRQRTSVFVKALERDRPKPSVVNVLVKACFYDAENVVPDSRFL